MQTILGFSSPSPAIRTVEWGTLLTGSAGSACKWRREGQSALPEAAASQVPPAPIDQPAEAAGSGLSCPDPLRTGQKACQEAWGLTLPWQK